MCNTRQSAATLPRMRLTSRTQAKACGLCLVINSWQLSTTGSQLAELRRGRWAQGLMLLSKQMLPIGDIYRPVSPKATRHVADCVQRGECSTNPLFAKFIIGQPNTLPVSATPFEQFSSIGNLTHLHRQAPRVEWVSVLSPLPSHSLRRQPGLVSHLDAVFAPHAGRKSLHPRQPTLQSRESSQELCHSLGRRILTRPGAPFGTILAGGVVGECGGRGKSPPSPAAMASSY